jgi:hypothetical protein
LVENSLPRAGISIAATGDASLDIVVVYLSIEHSFDAGFVPHFGVLALTTRLDESGETYSKDVGGDILLWSHCGGS